MVGMVRCDWPFTVGYIIMLFIQYIINYAVNLYVELLMVTTCSMSYIVYECTGGGGVSKCLYKTRFTFLVI